MSASGFLHATSPPAPRVSWADLKTRIRIPQVLAALGVLPRFHRQGGRWVGPCPIHGGDNPNAFTVNVDRNVWYCFTRCGRGGTVIDLALALCDGSWSRVGHWLSHLATVPMAAEEATSTPAGVGHGSRPFRAFRATLDLDPCHPFFRRMGLDPETVRQFEAGAWHGGGFLAGMVAVRLHDLAGQPLGYAGRRLDPELIHRWGKWKWPPSFPKRELLFGWHRVSGDLDRRLILVEGAWSVMKLHQAKVTGVVALGGTSASASQRALLARAHQVVLFLDGDEAGRAATARLTHDRLHSALRTIGCPTGCDPADLDEATLRGLLGPDA